MAAPSPPDAPVTRAALPERSNIPFSLALFVIKATSGSLRYLPVHLRQHLSVPYRSGASGRLEPCRRRPPPIALHPLVSWPVRFRASAPSRSPALPGGAESSLAPAPHWP